MHPEFDIIKNPDPKSHLWKQWKHLVDTEGWTSDDNSVTSLIPSLKSTRSVFAVTKTPEQNYIGSVVWNEYDDISWLGFFLLEPEYRGKGIGSVIWKIAMSCYSKDLVLALRGVVAMAPKYKANDTPVGGAVLENYRMTALEFHNSLKSFEDLDLTHKTVRNLTSEEWEKMVAYDRFVTGRDRKEFLELYYKCLDFTTGLVFFNQSNEVVSLVSSVPTSHREDNIFKISPLYADSNEIAFYAMKVFSKQFLEKHPTAKLVIHTVDIPSGSFNVFRSFFNGLGITPGCSGITLYSDQYPAKGDLNKVFIPHNNSCHFDF